MIFIECLDLKIYHISIELDFKSPSLIFVSIFSSVLVFAVFSSVFFFCLSFFHYFSCFGFFFAFFRFLSLFYHHLLKSALFCSFFLYFTLFSFIFLYFFSFHPHPFDSSPLRLILSPFSNYFF